MPTLGNTSKPGFSYHGFGGSGETNQEAEDLTLPDQRVRILSLGQWAAGWSGTCKARLCLWDDADNLLAYTDELTFANGGVPHDNGTSLYTADLLTPYEAEAGQLVRVGFTRNRDDAHYVNTGTTVNTHWHARGFYPAPDGAPPGDLGGATAKSSSARRIGSYIANYELMASAWVFRSGVWVRADAVKVYRSGSWVDADAVQVQRSGVWQDAD